MDCAPVPKLIDGPGWVYEIKLDGYRAVGVQSDCDVVRSECITAEVQRVCVVKVKSGRESVYEAARSHAAVALLQ